MKQTKLVFVHASPDGDSFTIGTADKDDKPSATVLSRKAATELLIGLAPKLRTNPKVAAAILPTKLVGVGVLQAKGIVLRLEGAGNVPLHFALNESDAAALLAQLATIQQGQHGQH